MMPNVNPRTNLTLKPELHDLIQETADHLGLKRAQLITNLLEEFAPQLEKMCFAFREIKEKQVDPSVVVSAFGAESMAQITQATAQLAQELAQMQKGKIMIDWATAKLPCRHDPSKLISGMVMSFDPQGNNEWVVNKKLSVEGSHSSKNTNCFC